MIKVKKAIKTEIKRFHSDALHVKKNTNFQFCILNKNTEKNKIWTLQNTI